MKKEDLPSNWWKYSSSAKILCGHFRKHILPLFISGLIDNKLQYEIYTGTLLKIKEKYVWLSAGHVIERFNKVSEYLENNSRKVRWLDGSITKNAENVPFNTNSYTSITWLNDGLDVGVIVPSLIDVENLKMNDSISPIDSAIWENLVSAKPEGFYAVGLPSVLYNYSHLPVGNGKEKHTVTTDILCLPIEQKAPPRYLAEDSNWSDETAFYAHILDYEDYPEFDIDNASGMSGGPIFSIELDCDKKIKYRLVGIIQQFARAQSYFRAEPIKKIAKKLELLDI